MHKMTTVEENIKYCIKKMVFLEKVYDYLLRRYTKIVKTMILL